MVSSTILTLIVIPAIYSLWREWQLRRGASRSQMEPAGRADGPRGAGDGDAAVTPW